MTLYKHTQVGWLIIALCVAVLIFVFAVVRSEEEKMIAIVVGGVLLLILLLFSFLTVEITNEEIRCSFWPGLIRKRFVLTELTEAIKVRNPWYYGYGIRMTPDGWMFNVSGPHAVRITLGSGKRFRIGTDEPDQLLKAIRDAAGLRE